MIYFIFDEHTRFPASNSRDEGANLRSSASCQCRRSRDELNKSATEEMDFLLSNLYTDRLGEGGGLSSFGRAGNINT